MLMLNYHLLDHHDRRELLQVGPSHRRGGGMGSNEEYRHGGRLHDPRHREPPVEPPQGRQGTDRFASAGMEAKAWQGGPQDAAECAMEKQQNCHS